MTDQPKPIIPLDFSESEEPEGEVEAIVEGSVGPAGMTESSEPKIPDKLPILPIRNAVVFPGTIMPLQINREKSQRVLDLALDGDRLIAVVAQRNSQTEANRSFPCLFKVTTIESPLAVTSKSVFSLRSRTSRTLPSCVPDRIPARGETTVDGMGAFIATSAISSTRRSSRGKTLGVIEPFPLINTLTLSG